jgi:hypothetical protein
MEPKLAQAVVFARTVTIVSVLLPILLPLAVYAQSRAEALAKGAAPQPKPGRFGRLLDRPALFFAVCWTALLVFAFGSIVLSGLLGQEPI